MPRKFGILLLLGMVPAATIISFVIVSTASGLMYSPTRAEMNAKLERFRLNGKIGWREVYQLRDLNFAGDWLEVDNAADCPLASADEDTSVFCKFVLHPGADPIVAPFSRSSCWAAYVPEGRIRTQRETRSGLPQEKWSDI